MADLLDRVSTRTLRLVGLAVILVGIPSMVLTWSGEGAIFGSLVAFGHIYLGAFIAFALPWIKARRSKPL